MNLTPSAIQAFFDNNGRPLAGGLLFTYAAGTTTKRATYQDSTSGSPNTNPIVLNFRGEARIWLDPTLSYRFVLAPSTDTDPPTNPIWTVDNITAGPASQDNAAQDTGSPNTVRLAMPALSSTPAVFDRIVWKSAFQNTGNTSVVVNGGLSKSLTWQNRANIGPGAIQLNGMYEAIYDGTVWQLQGPTLNPPEQLTTAEFIAGVVPVRYEYLPGDVRRYCSATETNHQQAFTDANSANSVIYIPAGTWNVDHFLMDIDSRTVVTEGFATIIHQRTGNINRRVVEICASNITFALAGVKITGNIATDTGEQQHGIFVSGDHPTLPNVNLTKITIGPVWGEDLRGDVVYLGAPVGSTTIGITCGMIFGNNILRNLVSIVGASTITGVGSYCLGSTGYACFDLEPNAGGVASTDVSWGWVRGGVCQIAPPTAATTARRIRIGQIDLDPAFQANSTPPYALYAAEIITGLWLRNCIDVGIEHASINNFTEYASQYIFNVGEQRGLDIRIGNLRGSNCGPNALNAFLEWSNVNSYQIGGGDVSLQSTTHCLVLGSSATLDTRGSISHMNINGTVARFGMDLNVSNLIRNDANDVFTFRDIEGLVVSNSDITGGRLLSNVSNFVFTSVTATCSTSYLSGACPNGRFISSAGGLASILRGSATYDPPSLADGAGTTTSITATGLALGDFVTGWGFSVNPQGITITPYISATDTIAFRWQNETGGVLDIASGTLIGEGAKT